VKTLIVPLLGIANFWNNSSFVIVVNRLLYLMHLNLRQYDLTCLRKSKELLNKNLQKKYTISDLSSVIGMSETKLKKGFKQVYGITIGAYVRQAKLNKAKELLEQTKHSESVIARTVGYTSFPSFVKAFTKHFNEHPHSVRKAKKNT